MKQLLITMAVAIACLGTAQANDWYEQFQQEFDNRTAKSVKGDNDVFNPESVARWRDGMTRVSVVSCMADDNETIDHLGFQLDDASDWDESKHYYEVKMVNNTPRVINRRGVTVKHEVIGIWDLLVFRNSAGSVLDVAIRTTNDNDIYKDLERDMHAMIDGVYKSASGDTAVFDIDLTQPEVTTCPGRYQIEPSMIYENKFNLGQPFDILFADHRMKVVELPKISKKYDEATGVIHYYANGKEISKKEYEFIESRPCGYGGHGSLMGPIVWKVKRTATGLHVELAQPYDANQDWRYSPFSDEKFDLTWVRSVYPGYKGRWAVASVRPLTRNMLRQFDKATLSAMVKGINARHTRDKNFSAIEKLNKSLINTILAGK